MAAALSRRLLWSVASRHGPRPPLSSFRSLTTDTTTSSNAEPDADFDLDGGRDGSDPSDADAQQKTQQQQRLNFERPLENGLDQGVYKAILVGKVGQKPVQKRLKSGRVVTMFSLGTGGIRDNRRPLEDEEPREYANRCAVQWHRVSVYPERLSLLAMKNVKPGFQVEERRAFKRSIIYLEGNLETKVFSDPISGVVRRIREIAIRRDGRFVFLGKGNEEQDQADIRGVGYF